MLPSWGERGCRILYVTIATLRLAMPDVRDPRPAVNAFISKLVVKQRKGPKGPSTVHILKEVKKLGAEEGIRAPHGVEIASGAVNPRGKLAFYRSLPNSKTTVRLCGTTFRFSKKSKIIALRPPWSLSAKSDGDILHIPEAPSKACIPLSQD